MPSGPGEEPHVFVIDRILDGLHCKSRRIVLGKCFSLPATQCGSLVACAGMGVAVPYSNSTHADAGATSRSLPRNPVAPVKTKRRPCFPDRGVIADDGRCSWPGCGNCTTADVIACGRDMVCKCFDILLALVMERHRGTFDAFIRHGCSFTKNAGACFPATTGIGVCVSIQQWRGHEV